jgi:predicted ATP-dependent protease
VPSSGKVMASVFWDALGILFIDYGKTIAGEYYSNLLTRLDEKFARKDPVCKRKNHLSSGQYTRPQKCFGNGKIKESAL